jgi:monothiol glutaredoxin
MGSPFRIVGGDAPVGGRAAVVEELTPVVQERLEQLVCSSDVFMLMKGTPERPACGFSANAVALLNTHGVDFGWFDVLSDPELRAAAKLYSDWPTFPQIFVRGELIGGHDILMEMAECDELDELIEGGQR